MVDIINISDIYSDAAYNLLVWANDCKNRIRRNKLIKIAERIENRYRDKHKNIFGEVYYEFFGWNPLHYPPSWQG